MKEVFLRLLQKEGRNGLEEVVDNLLFIVRSNNTELWRKNDSDLAKYFFKSVFDKRVTALLIQRLDQFVDPDGNQSLRLKASDFVYEAVSKFYLYSELFQGMIPLAETEIRQLIHLWFSSNDNEVTDHCLESFRKTFRNSKYRCFPIRNLIEELLYFFHTGQDVRSAVDARGYLIALQQKSLLNNVFEVLWEHPKIVSTMVSTLIKSVTYLVNCWRMLGTSDLIVEMRWIENRLWKLLEVIISIERNAWHYGRNKQLSKAGIGRLIRCVTFAFVKTKTRSNRFLWRFLDLQFELMTIEDLILHFFAFSSPFELEVLVKDMENLGLQSDREWIQNIIPLLSCLGDEDFKRFQVYDNQLSPLSREDSKILFVPSFVEIAISSLPDAGLLNVPKVGCWSLLISNCHLQMNGMIKELLDKFRLSIFFKSPLV